MQRDLITERRRMPVGIEDTYNPPLCTLGVQGFVTSIGLSRVRRISGWLVALMMKIKPQLGYVIDQAHQHTQVVAKRNDADVGTKNGLVS